MPARYVWTLESGREEAACANCRPASGVSAREIGARAVPAPVEGGPLTVEQAAAREQVSEKTIYRRLRGLEEAGGAWRVNGGSGPWRIDPDALTRARTERQAPRPRAKPDAVPRAARPANPAAWNQ